MRNQLFDVAIIGGGPARLNAALLLGRARKKLAVINEGREFRKTNIPGVYSAGDAASRLHQAIAVASKVAFAAAVINNERNTEAWRRNL
ncbi:hypothetical protein SAMN05421736_101742 [Evansella caseinilytica]|uniref:Thioredoxin reductase n=1 Tax=Evansella caseinilytica TaxID=1503961 RepID=A0A1H3I7N0_9BACI|nr:hypothetical protein [Evansella caseinilytica]SDY23743.1 hypothetical protein SAMN05421736_101742 [Evansella caseinilytica]